MLLETNLPGIFAGGDVRHGSLKRVATAVGEERKLVTILFADLVDSTALGVLIEARSRMADHEGFRLAAPGLEARRALEVSGLDRHFLVHDTVAEALEAAR